MANREINVNIQTDLEKIEADVIKDERRKEVFFKMYKYWRLFGGTGGDFANAYRMW